MYSKLKLTPRSVRNGEVDHVLDLARAGMSRRFIATEVFGTGRNEKPSESSRQRVDYILTREEMRVTDYRNGRNALGRAVTAAIRREANLLSVIRNAAKNQTKALKQQRKVG